ncbi:MAG: hypothetical protein CM15mP32_3370 [Flavobacteriaceae bacterium]|nr:MAG: hypothetical protein CM15mP32_3370 [Flavobacteriaceae bacterium]
MVMARWPNAQFDMDAEDENGKRFTFLINTVGQKDMKTQVKMVSCISMKVKKSWYN